MPTDEELMATLSPKKSAMSDDDVIAKIRGNMGILDTAIGAANLVTVAGTKMGEQAIAGVHGIAQSLNLMAGEGAGARRSQQIQEVIPDVSLNNQGRQLIQSLSQKYQDIAPETLKSLVSDFVSMGPDLGSRVMDITNSPLAATTTEMLPAALESIGGLRAGKQLASVARDAGSIIEGAAKYQGPAKREMIERISQGSTDKDLAPFQVSSPRISESFTTDIERFFGTNSPKLKKDPIANSAIKQGWREGVIQPLKMSSKPDKALARQMTAIAERAKKDELFGMENRPGDVAGDVLMGSLDVIRRANKRAGQALKPITDKMKGQTVDVSGIGAKLSDAFDDMGISLSRGDNGRLIANYEGSNIEGITQLTNGLDRVIGRIERVAGSGKIDAYHLHQLKKFIDDQVTFGKSAEGLSGQTERVLKKLRGDINNTLGDNFPDYAKANETYSGTIKAIDAFQEVAGRKMNLLGDNADKATGTLMRRLMSNAQSRITLLDSLDGIDQAVERFSGYGGPLKIEGKGGDKNNLKLLVLYADELDRMLGSAPRTSLQGQFDQAFNTAAKAATSQGGMVDAGIGVVGKMAGKAFGINEENALKSIKDLLKGTE